MAHESSEDSDQGRNRALYAAALGAFAFGLFSRIADTIEQSSFTTGYAALDWALPAIVMGVGGMLLLLGGMRLFRRYE